MIEESEATGAWVDTEPGAIVLIPRTTDAWTEDEVYDFLSGGATALGAAGHAFHMPGQHDQSSHGRGGRGVTGHDALAAPTISIGSEDGVVHGGYLNPEEAMALRRYRGIASTRINRHLRGQSQDLGEMTDAGVLAAEIKGAMAKSPLKQKITVTRGTKTDMWLPEEFQSGQGDMTGLVFRDKGFVSTSARTDHAKSFSRPGGVSMTITVPEGVSAIGLSDFTDEAEILLDSGLTFRVTKDNGMSQLFSYGPPTRMLEVEVVP